MMVLKDYQSSLKPREKALLYGLSALSDSELLALLLETSGIVGESVLSLANRLLDDIGGIGNLAKLEYHDIKVKGIGKAKALKVLGAIELGKRILGMKKDPLAPVVDSLDIYERFGNQIMYENVERVATLSLDIQKRPLKFKVFAIGDKFSCTTPIRGSLEEAVKANATFIVLIHNHPEGEFLPSPNDDLTTTIIQDTGRILGITLLDHLIVTPEGYYSYLDQKRAPFDRVRHFVTYDK